jgi:hypothetical protein
MSIPLVKRSATSIVYHQDLINAYAKHTLPILQLAKAGSHESQLAKRKDIHEC